MGAVVRATWWVGDSPRNPQNYLERVSFEHSPSPNDNVRSWHCQWHKTMSIYPNPLALGHHWETVAKQWENWVREGGEGGQMQLIMAPTLLWALGLTQRSDCSHLLSVECHYYTELDTFLLLLWLIRAGRTFGPARDFMQRPGKNQSLEEVIKSCGKKGSSYFMLPSTASTPHWVSLAQKSSHTAFNTGPLMANRQYKNPGHWNHLSLLKEFPP